MVDLSTQYLGMKLNFTENSYPELILVKYVGVVKTKKIFFYDLGVRNTLIDNMNRLSRRNDTGQLWENFLIIERLKTLSYRKKLANRYFWRTYTGAEIDYVEESGGRLQGYEFTFAGKKKKLN